MTVTRSSHLQIPGEQKMARAALRRRAIDGPFALMSCKSGVTHVYCLTARRATFGPYIPLLDGPVRRAKNGPSQMRRPGPIGLNIICAKLECHRPIINYCNENKR